MIEKDTIKGLECCLDEKIEKCDECPYSVDTLMCKRRELLEDTFNLINHKQELLDAAIAGQETLQKALAKKEREIGDLKVENQSLRTAANYYKLHYNEARDEAIGEFATGIKKILGRYYSGMSDAIDYLENKLRAEKKNDKRRSNNED